MMRRITILGASARAAAFSAVAAGFEPYAIDLFTDRDLAALCPAVKIERYPHDFLAALAAAPDCPWIYTGGLENYPRLIERLAAIRPLWGNRGFGLRAARNPLRVAEIARQAGLNFPEAHLASGRRKPPGDLTNQWLLKPMNSSGGLTIRFATERDFSRLLRHSLLQRYIPGKSASAVFVAAAGRAILLGCSHQITGRDIGINDRPFLYAGSLAPLNLPGNQLARLTDFGNLLAAELKLVGLFGVDFVIVDNSLWILEVNPRYTASIEVLERVAGIHFLTHHVAACENGVLPDQSAMASARHAGKRIIYSQNDAIVPPGFDEIVRAWNAAAKAPLIADLPWAGDKLLAGQPICTVLAEGDSKADIELSLTQRAAAVHNVLNPRP